MDATPLPPPPPQPFSLSPPTPIPHLQNHPHFLIPFTPSTTPTSSSPTATLRKKRRSKLLRIETTSYAASTSKRPDPSAKEITPSCTECGKVFCSWKALFGHMRCHPERKWRGINPPARQRHRPFPSTPPTPTNTDDREVAASLLLLAAGPASTARFECSSCKKTFGSHQALGGHRASHKYVKGCFAITMNNTDVEDDQFMIMQSGSSHEEGDGLDLTLGLALGMGHKCWVCSKVFPTGQVLSGHMRYHWESSDERQHQVSPSSFGLSFRSDSRPIETQYDYDLNLPVQLLEDGSSTSVTSSKNMQLELKLGI